MLKRIAMFFASNLPDAAFHTVVAVLALFFGFGHVLQHWHRPHDTGTHHPA